MIINDEKNLDTSLLFISNAIAEMIFINSVKRARLRQARTGINATLHRALSNDPSNGEVQYHGAREGRRRVAFSAWIYYTVGRKL